MKKKILIIALFLIVILFFVYNYVYQSHRDISKEDASITTSSTVILNDFKKDEASANAKYLDKTIAVSGKVTTIDIANNTIVLDGQLFCMMGINAKDVKVNDQVSVKGRFLGYDELVEELKMDQITLIK